MNIAIDLRPLIGGRLSGVEIFTGNLVKNLVRIDHKNTYILWINSFAGQSETLAGFSVPAGHPNNVRCIQTKIPNRILNFLLFFFNKPSLSKLLSKKLSLKIDLFLLPDLRPASFGKKVKTICVVHDLSFERYPEFFSKKTRIWYKLLNAKKRLKSFDGIIAVSASTKKDLIETYKIDPQKIKVIHEGSPAMYPHGMEAHSFNGEKIAAVRKKYALPSKYFFFLSTIEPRKNIRRMIDAFHEFKKTDAENIKLVIGGAVCPEIFARQKIRIPKDVILTGFIPEDEKPYLFHLAEAFVYPSLYEGFGLPLLEAMSCGTPIITSNTSSMPEVCGDAALFFDPENTEEITAAMRKIVNPNIRAGLKEKMSAQIKKFNWNKCAEETLELIESL